MTRLEARKRLKSLTGKQSTFDTYWEAALTLMALGFAPEKAVELLEGLYSAAASDYGD